MKKNFLRIILTGLLLVSMPLVFSCDTKPDNGPPCVMINVTLGSGEVPSSTKKLYAIFHGASNWAAPLFTVTSDTNTIVIPPLNIWKTTFYMEIIYDISGTGNPATSGNWYQGWYRKLDRLTPDLTAFIVPEIPIVFLNIAMDTPVTSLTPVTPADANYNVIP